METTCLFREPTDWLFSWYKYRARENIRSKPQSTADMDFDEFAARYIAQDPLVFDIGRSSNFVSGPDGQPAVDQIFRFDRLDSFGGFLENRFEKKLEFEILNPSPEKPFSISASRRAELEQFLAPEFDIYENARR